MTTPNVTRSNYDTGAIHLTVQRAAEEALNREPIQRADSNGTYEVPFSVERLLTEQFIASRADAMGIDCASPAGQRWVRACKQVMLGRGGTRADGAYYEGSLRTLMNTSPLMEPTQDRGDILSGIPERRISVGAATYALRSAEVSGVAQEVTPEVTSYPRPSYNLNESGGSLKYFAFEIPDHWLATMYQNFAGVDVGTMNITALRRAFVEAEFAVRMSGSGALLGIKQLGITKRTSAVTYAGSTAIATLYDDFIGLIDDAKEASATSAAFDTLIVAEKVWLRLSRSTNLGSGGDTNARAQIIEALRERGISRVIMGKSLTNLFSTTASGALLYQSSEEYGLMQVRQMNVAPVHTYNSANGVNTVYAASWGGFECPRAETALLLELPTG